MSRSSVAPAAQRDPTESPYYFGKVGEVAPSCSHGTRSATFSRVPPPRPGRHVILPPTLGIHRAHDAVFGTLPGSERPHHPHACTHARLSRPPATVGTMGAFNHQTPDPKRHLRICERGRKVADFHKWYPHSCVRRRTRSSTVGAADYSQPSPRALGFRVSVVAPDLLNRVFGRNCHHSPPGDPPPPSPNPHTHARPRQIPSECFQEAGRITARG